MPSRNSLLASLKDKSVVIPDLYTIFTNWVQVKVNQSCQKLKTVSDERLKSVFSDAHKLCSLQASDFAFFAATRWPKAQCEEFVVLLHFTMCLFKRDDEIDEPRGLGEGRLRTDAPQKNRIIASFKKIGESLTKAYTPAQRNRFLAEMVRFMKHTKARQKFRLRKRIPNAEEYWSFRMGTSAVGTVVVTLVYAIDIRIYNTFTRIDEGTQAITDETPVNDLSSL